ncbi:uncharacterized protein LOC107670269 [Sinocyclocheilus anshuiensis]|uniref:uncharacterized protein LOC107670269 n=1 Tax=Sinocyclocheilus anshuiensis TaxID=1608454 RepID=UPI0007BAD5A5|nr:PREDICTED: uncharacterized protein LOC107670269 [Sinocyclocheilus anshuiensis]
MAESRRHTTIQRGKELPQLQQCQNCCSLYHCPFCRTFKPTRLDKLTLHLQSHSSKAVVYDDFTIHRCGLGCRPALHYHCPYCGTTALKRRDFEHHLQICKNKSLPTSDITDVQETPSAASVTVTTPAVKKAPLPTCETVTTLAVKKAPLPTCETVTTPVILPTTIVSSGRVRVQPVIKRRCPICSVLMNRKNLKKHIDRKHIEQPMQDISAAFHLTSQCVDKTNGIFTVLKATKGQSVPLHVQYKTWGEEHKVLCEVNECQVNMEVARRSGLFSYQCKHIKSVMYCTSSAEPVTLKEEVLTEMVKAKWFGSEKKKICLTRQQLADGHCMPISVQTSIDIPQTKKFISVFEPSVSYYSRLGRVMVVYDTKLNTWHCPCAKSKCSCVHKYIAKWHLFQTQRDLFRTVFSTEHSPNKRPHPQSEEEEDFTNESPVYPPKGLGLKNMVSYIFQNKKIPAVLPDDVRVPSPEKNYPRSLCPYETMCQRCPGVVPLSDPILITRKAKILSNWHIIEDVATYSKQCPLCGMFYHYQEWKDGLHNFNDHIILDLPLCLTLRGLLQVHTAVSRAVDFLQDLTGYTFPPADTVLHAYLHFEALTEQEYTYSCVTCGDYPPVVIMDLHKKGVFQFSVSDVEEPPESFQGEVNLETFWEALSKEMICRGFVTSGAHNPFAVPPTYHFWAPWIGKNTRRSDTVLNTEFEKRHASKFSSEISEITVTKERLKEELRKQKVNVIRRLCKECGLDSTGSRNDLLLRLSKEMKSRQTYDKIFEKIWGASENMNISSEETTEIEMEDTTLTSVTVPTTENEMVCNIKHLSANRVCWDCLPSHRQSEMLDWALRIENPDETIAEIDNIVLKRKDFWTLGLNEQLEATIANSCLEVVALVAKEQGMDVWTADAYVVATWLPPNNLDPSLSFPDHIAFKDAIVFPAWKPGHWMLC